MKNVNTDVAYEYIRKRILSGEYSPGMPLMTEVLAKDIKVSRTPVRDALRKLETDGLVVIRAHMGASVKQMRLKEFRELCDLRLALESHAAGLAAANRTVSDLREIEFALLGMRRLTDHIIKSNEKPPALIELAREDARFHIAIMTAAKNDLMKREILRLHLINRVMVNLPGQPGQPYVPKQESDARRREVLSMHEKIYDAIAQSDVLRAKHEMEFHLQELISHNLTLMARVESGVFARDLSPDELAYGS